MAEKAASKKENQQKNQKRKQPEKKKNQENVKPVKKSLASYQKKKNDKNIKNKYNNFNYHGENNIHKTHKKKPGLGSRNLLWLLLTHITFGLLVIGFLYIVDFEKFVRIRDGAGYYINKTVSILPPEMVTKGKLAVEYFRPVAEITLHKGNAFINETSTFLNSNPLVKEHWANIREISSICSARLVDYMRTLYLQTTGAVMNVKKIIF